MTLLICILETCALSNSQSHFVLDYIENGKTNEYFQTVTLPGFNVKYKANDAKQIENVMKKQNCLPAEHTLNIHVQQRKIKFSRKTEQRFRFFALIGGLCLVVREAREALCWHTGGQAYCMEYKSAYLSPPHPSLPSILLSGIFLLI